MAMATLRGDLILTLVVLVVSTFVLHPCAAHQKQPGCTFEAIYTFGDSTSDTGNLYNEPAGFANRAGRLPYGINYPTKTPTGRWTNGLVMSDLFASAFSLPSPKPYLGTDKDFKSGVNFAVAWATALDTPVLAKFNIPHWYTDSSLLVQVSWFETYIASICSNKTDCKKKLENSIFVVGDIGSIDYTSAKLRHLNSLRVAALTPLIAKTIAQGVQRLIDHGASRIIVSGSLPVGCLTSNLDFSRSNYSRAYDEFGCLKSLNSFAANHNTQLQKALEGVRAKNPEVTLLYGDAFKSYQEILHNAERYGLTKNNTLNACCGAPWKEYNYDQFSLCGIVNTTVCSEPEKYLNWDGTSLTQNGYNRVVNWILHQLTPFLKCNNAPKPIKKPISIAN
ncbi:hypothetical protein Scep_018283 [Stephania cephalantha]|uniref:Uncharacterized protein n=1 Tax=Stephania cephalantha TaxID=152367 RepID=A0AAP0NWF5_9MAGN